MTNVFNSFFPPQSPRTLVEYANNTKKDEYFAFSKLHDEIRKRFNFQDEVAQIFSVQSATGIITLEAQDVANTLAALVVMLAIAKQQHDHKFLIQSFSLNGESHSLDLSRSLALIEGQIRNILDRIGKSDLFQEMNVDTLLGSSSHHPFGAHFANLDQANKKKFVNNLSLSLVPVLPTVVNVLSAVDNGSSPQLDILNNNFVKPLLSLDQGIQKNWNLTWWLAIASTLVMISVPVGYLIKAVGIGEDSGFDSGTMHDDQDHSKAAKVGFGLMGMFFAIPVGLIVGFSLAAATRACSNIQDFLRWHLKNVEFLLTKEQSPLDDLGTFLVSVYGLALLKIAPGFATTQENVRQPLLLSAEKDFDKNQSMTLLPCFGKR